MIVGTSNAVNLTDGLDGLAILPTVLVAGALGLLAYLAGNFQFANYPHTLYQWCQTIDLRCCYLWCWSWLLMVCTYPQWFLWENGSLALGAALGVMAVVVRQEIVLLIMGGVFVIETVLIIMQVVSFDNGQAHFFDWPPHHHYELRAGQSRE